MAKHLAGPNADLPTAASNLSVHKDTAEGAIHDLNNCITIILAQAQAIEQSGQRSQQLTNQVASIRRAGEKAMLAVQRIRTSLGKMQEP